ncbi:MAG: hydroxymethylbilane synthase [Eubacterium aggregans]|uniref:hydroxymethylbilane synthase n=1 Tax=Eubacterium aggregans TaxID=81409 RepID=UPI002B219AE9|nr:hydroxymethylbilane synthase [Eubacterium aggregans]MEA5074431.1 hydroxymethylbilane synthase [Eubacterium aggregans]
MKIIVGSRGSKLAVVQTNWLLDTLRKANPQVDFELKIITTKGDTIQHKALDAIGDKGLFTKELEDALLSGKIQMAVHSMKDMPSSLPEGLTLSVPPKREDPSDVLVTPHAITSILDLPQGAVVATGSKRRIYQLKALRPDLEIVGIRGNIDTRIRKMQEQGLDGIILAAAGMRRIGVYDAPEYHVVPLNPSTFVCAPAQGILAVEIREDNEDVKALMATVCDERTRVQMEAERGFLVGLNGDCHIPIGAYCELAEDGSICLHGLYGTEDGSRLVADILTGDARQAAEIGNQLAIAMKGQVDG